MSAYLFSAEEQPLRAWGPSSKSLFLLSLIIEREVCLEGTQLDVSSLLS